jgi:putative phosphoesterase
MTPSSESPHVIGLISDTHGELRPAVHSALAGVELILHAGDVGGDEILQELRLIAPVHAVAGNTDPQGTYQPELRVTVGGLRIHVSHGHELGGPTPKKLAVAYDADVIVYGHTHQQLVTRMDGCLVVNPGAAGPARFKLRPSVGLLTISAGTADVEIVALD